MKTKAELEHEAVWRRYDEVELRLTAGVSERMLDLAGVQSGSRVLDLASGRGEPAIRAAHRVGSAGYVLGVDLYDGLLDMARERAQREGALNLELRAGDARDLAGVPEASFDAVTCRWGLMYMHDPVAVLTKARRALAPSGLFVAAFWCEPERVPYHSLPRRILERYRELPAPDLDAPGVFRFAELERTKRDFEAAGLVIDHTEERSVMVFEAETSDEVVDWVRAFGLARLLEDVSESDRAAWREELTLELEAQRVNGRYGLGGVTCLVRARIR
jgi:ubiquinone/menaquinone biosynthesis C-methylase UbiE